ncbi:MAG: urease accessory protein UreF [Halioglobus sp.]
MLADLRLYQLISPALPIGGFTYSQGLEWAVEAQWVSDKKTLEDWVAGLLDHSIATLELPVLMRLQQAFSDADELAVVRWSQYLLASRETLELRKEERQRGAALARLLTSLDVSFTERLAKTIAGNQLAGIALAANFWEIDPVKTMSGYAWSWLENSVMAGVKLIPLGQTHGQQILLELAHKIPAAVATAMAIPEENIGSSTPALAIASSNHEKQYTRLFRS